MCMICLWYLASGGEALRPPPNPPPAFSSKPSRAIFSPAPHAVSTTAGSYHAMLSRKPCQHQKNMQTQQQTIKQIGKLKHQWISRKKLQELMKKEEQQWKKHATTNEKKENHARTHEKQRTTMQKPMKHHEKAKEKPCKNQWKPRRNNENKCIHHTYPTFMYHLYSMSKWYIYDITFHIVRIHSWCVLIHYICYLSEGGHEEPKK